MPVDTLSLYLDLEEGQKADLEVASRAAIAFAETVREIAAFVDPFGDVKVELIGTTEGSISFDTKIRFRTASGTKEITLYALVIVCMIYLGSHVGDFLIEKGLDKIWEQTFGEETKKLTQAEIDDVARTVVQAIDARAGEKQAKSIYAELEKDQSVKGVGLTTEPGTKPRIIVPSFEFLKRSGTEISPEPAEKKRKRKETKTVVLVSPVLQHDRKRRWKFRLGEHEFGAPIKDEYFLDAVFSGKHPILLKGNIQMRVRLEVNEEYINGVWVPKDHTIWQVIGVPGQYQGPQQSLLFDESPQASNKDKKSQ